MSRTGIPARLCVHVTSERYNVGSDDFTILDGLALILAVEVEVDLGVLDFPGTILVREEAVLLEGDFTVRGLPPAKLVLVDALSVEVDLGVFDSPPAETVLEVKT